MIQDISPHQFSNTYKPEKPDSESWMLCYDGRKVLVKKDPDGRIAFPAFKELEPYSDNLYAEYTYLFSIDGQRYYLGDISKYGMVKGCSMEDTEILRTAGPRHLAFAGITGAQLNRWYQSHRFCGTCGSRMEQDGKERMMYCGTCGNREYPKIMPAVIIGVTNGDRLLMSKYANRDFKKYALLAGFTEIGETVEETVKREVLEEVGLKVKNVRYYKSQPWSFSDTLLMGFFADLDGEEEITLDAEELSLAEWFQRDEIPVKENNISLTNEMIMRFKYNEI